MNAKSLVLFAAGAAAHFGLTFPEWRADSLSADEASGINQRIHPCANVPSDNAPTTNWPISGGAIKLDLHHDWTYVFINLGLGTNVTNFNITLTPQLWNATGSGTLCVPSIPLPADLDIKAGDEGSIQVVTVGDNGAALYNCADVTFTDDAEAFGGEECVTEGIEYYVVGEVEDPITSTGEVPDASAGGSSGGDGAADGDDAADGDGAAGNDSEGAANGRNVPGAVLTSVAGLAFAFVVGMTL